MDAETYFDQEIWKLNYGLAPTKIAPHTPIFKFVSLNSEFSWARLEETIATRSFPASAANGLNDPFDLQPSYVDDISSDFLEKLYPLRLEDRLQGLKATSFTAADVSNAAEVAKLELEKLRTETKIVSFSARLDSGLLWSHYANGYRGACLFFLKAGDRFGVFDQAARVSYSLQRPIYPLSLIARLSKARKEIRFSDRFSRLNAISNNLLYFTKAPDWGYEAEIRIVISSYLKQEMEFRREEFFGIVIGPLTSAADLQRLKDLKAAHLPSLKIFQSSISTSAFSIQVDWQSPIG